MLDHLSTTCVAQGPMALKNSVLFPRIYHHFPAVAVPVWDSEEPDVWSSLTGERQAEMTVKGIKLPDDLFLALDE